MCQVDTVSPNYEQVMKIIPSVQINDGLNITHKLFALQE